MESNSFNSDSITNNRRIKVAILGATGYGGLQTVRILSEHPHFDIVFLGGEKSAGKRWNQLFPFLSLQDNPVIEKISITKITQLADYAIISLPNGIASKIVPDLIKNDIRVIDLSADYRYKSLTQWNQIYVEESKLSDRTDHDLCEEAVYGLPEWNKEKIAKARIVASPGCFPTASLLPLLPFLKQGFIENEGIIIDAKSGTSGGGRTANENLLLAESSETIKPYNVIGHRHTSEIEQLASKVAGNSINIQFTPHLTPMVRGILATVYARLRDPGLTAEDCSTLLKAHYRDQSNIDILPVGIYPSTKWVRYTNRAILSVQVDSRSGIIVLMSAIDNLYKGQAGQAIQSLNIMEGFNESIGLDLLAVYP